MKPKKSTDGKTGAIMHGKNNVLGCNGCDDITADLDANGYCSSCMQEPRAKAEHTPGPWAYDWAANKPVCREIWITSGVKQKLFASVWDSSDDKMEANARLIAAAPDLLKAAKLAEARYCGCHGKTENGSEWHGEGCARPALRAAIAKAEGR